MQRDLVFTDFRRGEWVRVATPSSLPRWQQLEHDTEAQFQRAMLHGAPVVSSLAETFRVRLVFDVGELRERLLIADAGLDDAIVECAKLACVAERPELVGPGQRIRLREVSAGGSIVFATVSAESPDRDLARWSARAGVLARISADRASWRARNPELFERAFVSLDRYLLAG